MVQTVTYTSCKFCHVELPKSSQRRTLQHVVPPSVSTQQVAAFVTNYVTSLNGCSLLDCVCLLYCTLIILHCTLITIFMNCSHVCVWHIHAHAHVLDLWNENVNEI